jgi:hypothetical protein
MEGGEGLGHLSRWPCMFLMSGQDSFVKDDVPCMKKVMEIWAKATGAAVLPITIPEGPHDFSGHKEKAVNHIITFLQDVCMR